MKKTTVGTVPEQKCAHKIQTVTARRDCTISEAELDREFSRGLPGMRESDYD